MRDVYIQLHDGVRLEWGLAGAKALSASNGCLVVIDVLSFSTSVSVALSRGMSVLPCQWGDDKAVAFARERGAELAVGRNEVTTGNPWSLSPASLLDAPPPPTGKLVLPSPNGSAIAHAASTGTDSKGANSRAANVVVTASLRNGTAVAEALVRSGFGHDDRPIVLIAAGEHWPDGSFRPALEDQLGAGMIVDQLIRAGCPASVETEAAANVWRGVSNVSEVLSRCSSGQELIADGYENDVLVAADVDADVVVPVLADGAFVDNPSIITRSAGAYSALSALRRK